MDPGYPRKIKTDWPAIGNKIDAAFEHSGKMSQCFMHAYDSLIKQYFFCFVC